ncbi:hypothetical protein Aperf_G00000044976 [Anoplocephala perfoliata]
MVDFKILFYNELKLCLARLSLKKFDKKSTGDIFESVENLFKSVANEKAPVDENNANGEIICDNLPLGPLAAELIESDFLSKLLSWVLATECPSNVRPLLLDHLLRNFDFLISQAKQNLLFSSIVFQPILKVIYSCRDCSDRFSESVSRLLRTLSVLLCRDPILLEFSKQVSHDVTRNEYFIFSSLVPLLHFPGISGTNARDALLLILALSDRDTEVADYLTSRSDICPVLATGLSGHYSCLPKRLVLNALNNRDQSGETLYVRGAGWHRITHPEWSKCEPLVRFLQTLDFCNLAVRISHLSVRQCLLYYIYSGFLMSVLRPALNQNSPEEMIAAEAYLELFLRRLTEPSLIGIFLRFIVASTDENGSVLSSLITRLSANSTGPGDKNYLVSRGFVLENCPASFDVDFFKRPHAQCSFWVFAVRLGMVTLSLFRTILNLNCEDIMFLLVFQYLNRLDFVVDNATIGESKKRDVISLPNVDNLSWLASSERFSKLSFWCTDFNDPLVKSPRKERSRIKYAPPDRVAGCLMASYRLINGRTRSTRMWSSEYASPQPSLVPTSSTDPPTAPLHSTPLRSAQMTSSLRVEPESNQMAELSLVDRYKSESNIYQLSYCDDSDEETDKKTEKSPILPRPSSYLKSSEFTVDLELSPKQENSLLDAVRRFLVEINGEPTPDAVSSFIHVLAVEFRQTGEEDCYGTNIPFPPVSQLILDMLDFRLGLKTLPELVPPDSPVVPQILSPVSNLETEYDFNGLYGNELPELPYRPTFAAECSPLRRPSKDIGPFLTCVLNRIGSMHKNCLYTNLLLTDIAVILASFNQFPLPDVLLRGSNLPPNQSLYQVLVCLRRELEQNLARIPNWPSLVDQAMRFLQGPSPRNPEAVLPSAVAMNSTPNFASDEDILAAEHSSSARIPMTSIPLSRSPLPPRPPRPHHHRSSSESPRTAVLEPTVVQSPTPTGQPAFKGRSHPRHSSIDRLTNLFNLTSPSLPPRHAVQPTTAGPLPSNPISADTRNLIFAYIIFNEFCLELAALACEHEVSTASVQPQFEKTMELERDLAEF